MSKKVKGKEEQERENESEQRHIHMLKAAAFYSLFSFLQPGADALQCNFCTRNSSHSRSLSLSFFFQCKEKKE